MKRPKPPALRPPDYGSPAPGASPDGDERQSAGMYTQSSSDFGSLPQGGDRQGGRGGRPGGRPRGPGAARRQRAQSAGGGFGTESADDHHYGHGPGEREDAGY